MTGQDRKTYWEKHFSEQHADVALSSPEKLDFSNDRVRIQTYGWILESVGLVRGRSCLDAGCGTGEIAVLLASLGASVDAFDIAPAAIATLETQHPHIRWFVGDLDNVGASNLREGYDMIVSSEVLQYVNAASTVDQLWQHVSPGGRLVVVVPYAGCPIVQSVQNRFNGHYQGMSLDTVGELAASLADVEKAWWRGAAFLDDQSLFPYKLTPWSERFSHSSTVVPNRIQFVLSRSQARST